MKKLMFAFLLGGILFSCKKEDLTGFIKIPENLSSNEAKIIGVTPNKNYTYWEIVKVTDEAAKTTIKKNGDESKAVNLSYEKPKSGIFGTWGGYYYIAYIENGTFKVINTYEALNEFIGQIDNLEEALIIAKENNLSFSTENKYGGSYRKTENGFELYLTKFSYCPIYQEAYKTTISNNRNFNAKSLKIKYKEEEGCYEVD